MPTLIRKISAIVMALALPTAVVFSDFTIPLNTYEANNTTINLPTSPPWLSATFSQTGRGVTVDLSAPLLTSGQYSISYWDFNYEGPSPQLIFTPSSQSGFAYAYYYGPSSGSPNIDFGFDSTFAGQMSILITAPSGINADDPVTPPLNVDDFMTAWNINPVASHPIFINSYASISNNKGGFASIYNSPAITVSAPEPMTYICLATLLILVAVAARRKGACEHS